MFGRVSSALCVSFACVASCISVCAYLDLYIHIKPYLRHTYDSTLYTFKVGPDADAAPTPVPRFTFLRLYFIWSHEDERAT